MPHENSASNNLRLPAENIGRGRYGLDGRTLLVVLVVLFVLILIRTAWVCDDAYITFRTVDNFAHGYGLRYNVDERVQSFTNPLWLFLMTFAYLFSGEFYFTAIVVGVVVSVAAILLLVFGIARSTGAALLAVVVLCLSKAFTDYSTSGLESPLTHLLLALFALVFLRYERTRRSLILLSVIAALGALNRIDSLLLYIPPLAYFAMKWGGRHRLRSLALGFSPFILWVLFSFFYYGSPVPNTALAKLGTGYPEGEVLQQGLLYLLNSLILDPLTLFAILSTSAVAVFRKESIFYPFVIGTGLYLIYIVLIGGDFMSGRFLTPVLFVSVIGLAGMNIAWKPAGLAAALATVLLFGLTPEYNPLFSGFDYGRGRNQDREIGRASGIADERGFYYEQTGLLNWQRGVSMPNHRWREVGEAWQTGDSGQTVIGAAIGFAGYWAGPDIHIIDIFGLADPLLSRMRAAPDPDWRVGHAARAVPDGYLETVETGVDQIADSGIARFYDKVKLVTQGSLLSWSRLKTAVALNLGSYDHWLPTTLCPPVRVDFKDMQTETPAGSSYSGEGTHRIFMSGTRVVLGQMVKAHTMEIALDHNDSYKLVFVVSGNRIDSLTLEPTDSPGAGMAVHEIDIPSSAVRGFDELWIYPTGGDKLYSVGHLKFDSADVAPAASDNYDRH